MLGIFLYLYIGGLIANLVMGTALTILDGDKMGPKVVAEVIVISIFWLFVVVYMLCFAIRARRKAP